MTFREVLKEAELALARYKASAALPELMPPDYPSVFKQKMAEIKALKKYKAPDNQIRLAIVQASRDTILDMLPIAENIFKRYKNEKAVVGFTQLIKQLQDLNKEIAILEDAGEITQTLTESQKQLFTLISQFVANQVYILIKETETLKSPHDARFRRKCDAMLSNLTPYLQDLYNKSIADIEKTFG